MADGIIIYGIPNCDTMRKARAWLAQHGLATTFHDYRKEGVDRVTLERWVARLGWEALINRSGTTFRRLSPEMRESLDQAKALDLMIEHCAVIRRPVLEAGKILLVGFRPDDYARELLPPDA